MCCIAAAVMFLLDHVDDVVVVFITDGDFVQ